MAFGKLHTIGMIGFSLLGVMILLISLAAANRFTTGSNATMTGNQIYFGRKILPDHLLYPALMVHDRFTFESATPDQQFLLRISYADDRYESARQLLEYGKNELAMTTLTKSQKYLILSGIQLLQDDSIDLESREKLLQALDHSLYRLQEFQKEYQGTEPVVISGLIEETKVLQQQLNKKFSTEENQTQLDTTSDNDLL